MTNTQFYDFILLPFKNMCCNKKKSSVGNEDKFNRLIVDGNMSDSKTQRTEERLYALTVAKPERDTHFIHWQRQYCAIELMTIVML